MTIMGFVRNFNAMIVFGFFAFSVSFSWAKGEQLIIPVGEIRVPVVDLRHLGHGELVVVLFEKLDRIEIEMDKAFRVKKLAVISQDMTAVFSMVPYGEYAVGVFHDLNENGRLDANFFGFPKEDMAVSNNAKGGPLGGPPWQASKIQLAQPTMNLSALKIYPFGPKSVE